MILVILEGFRIDSGELVLVETGGFLPIVIKPESAL
jgi:hypothetical protein